MKCLLSCWDVVATKIKEARQLLLLMDYDGTLTPIVERPELAELSPEVRGSLQQLARNARLTLGVISGRIMEDLRERVGVSGIVYAANHGLEVEGPGINFVHPMAKKSEPLLDSLYQDIRKAIADIEGARIDNKGLTLSLHYRLVDEARLGELNASFFEIVKAPLLSGEIRITPSKKAYDIRPGVDWGKGEAIELIAQKVRRDGEPLIIFLGDDVTDYDGFRVVNSRGGISIYVGEDIAEPGAQYLLPSPKETHQLLKLLGNTFSSQ